jgi:cytochrome c553
MPLTKPARQRIATLAAGLAIASMAAAALAADDGATAPKATAQQAAAQKAAAPFLDLRRQQPIEGDAAAGKAASAVCSACHGANGIAVAPNFPNLAGQSATYLYVQLKTFKAGQRVDPVMASMAAPLDDATMRNLAAYYASLPPKGDAQAATTSLSPAATLFGDGDPSRGIPPCQGCHGIAARGLPADGGTDGSRPHPPWSTIPRLKGQSGLYVAKALRDFRDGARAGTSNAMVMHGVAGALDDAEIQALADFIGAQ